MRFQRKASREIGVLGGQVIDTNCKDELSGQLQRQKCMFWRAEGRQMVEMRTKRANSLSRLFLPHPSIIIHGIGITRDYLGGTSFATLGLYL